MFWLLPWSIATATPVPPCHEVRSAVKGGTVRLDQEALYVRSLAMGCRPAAAALGTLGTASAREVLAKRSPEVQAYGMVHDLSDAGLDALLWLAADPETSGAVRRHLPAGHPLWSWIHMAGIDECAAHEVPTQESFGAPSGRRRDFYVGVGAWGAGHCRSTADGLAWCEQEGHPGWLLEGRLQTYGDGWTRPIPQPVRGGAVSLDEQRVAVVHADGDVFVYDLPLEEGQVEEGGWPPLLPTTWHATALASARHGLDVPFRAPVGALLPDPIPVVRKVGSVAAFTSDGQAVVTLDSNRPERWRGMSSVESPKKTRVQVWDAATGEKWHQVEVWSQQLMWVGFEASGWVQVRLEGDRRVRLFPGPEAAKPRVEPEPKPDGCREVLIMEGGEKVVRRFDENGLRCD